VDGATLGLAGAAQIFRLDQQVDYLRRGHVFKTTRETRYGVLSLTREEAAPDRILGLVRGYWGIETRQHYRRDHTQREDHCQVRHPTAARNLALTRRSRNQAVGANWVVWKRRLLPPLLSRVHWFCGTPHRLRVSWVALTA